MGRITFTKTKGKRNRTVPVAPWLLAMLPPANRAACSKIVMPPTSRRPSGWPTSLCLQGSGTHHNCGTPSPVTSKSR